MADPLAPGGGIDLQTVISALQQITNKLGAIAQAGVATFRIADPASFVTHSAAAGSTLIKTGAGALLSVSVNGAATGSLAFYDGTSAGGKLLGVISTATQDVFDLYWPFQTGLFMVQTGTADVTIVNT